MASQTDLDQGGTFRQRQKVWMGPSIGFWDGPATVILPITTPGTTVLFIGTTLVTVNVNGSVTIQLPKFKGSAAGAQVIPGPYIAAQIVVVDIGGFAQANPITILPGAGEFIDGQSSVSLASAFGAFNFQPDVINGGSILVQ